MRRLGQQKHSFIAACLADGTVLRSAWREAGTDRAKNMTNEFGQRAFLFPGKVPGFENVFPDLERLNPAYFQTLDRKMDYLNEQGFIPFVEVARRDIDQGWKKSYPWPQSYVHFIQYVWRRYQAHIALFSPIHFDTPAQSIPPQEWNRAAISLAPPSPGTDQAVLEIQDTRSSPNCMGGGAPSGHETPG